MAKARRKQPAAQPPQPPPPPENDEVKPQQTLRVDEAQRELRATREARRTARENLPEWTINTEAFEGPMRLAELLIEYFGIREENASDTFRKRLSAARVFCDSDKRAHEEWPYQVSLFAAIMKVAADHNISIEDVVVPVSTRTFPWHLLPQNATLTIVGGEGDGHRSMGVSLFDFFAARKLAQRITRDYTKLRIAPAVEAPNREQRCALLVQRALNYHAGPRSIISLGSSRSNTMTEHLLADIMFVRHQAFEQAQAPAVSTSLPFHFCYQYDEARSNGRTAFGSYSQSVIPHLLWTDGPEQKELFYKEATESTEGIDHAVVVMRQSRTMYNHRKQRRGDVVVAGLRGIGTFGAAWLLAQHPEDLESADDACPTTINVVQTRFRWQEDLLDRATSVQLIASARRQEKSSTFEFSSHMGTRRNVPN